MWLDFARDYGVIIFGILLGFIVWTIVCFIRMLFSDNKGLHIYITLVAFVLFNYHFMFEATAFNNRNILYLGMFIFGFIASNVAEKDSIECRDYIYLRQYGNWVNE